MKALAYQELTGKTWTERKQECPDQYWCHNGPIGSELWVDPHGLSCPKCMGPGVDTSPDGQVFMCSDCGLHFALIWSQDIPDKAMVRPRDPNPLA